MPGGLDGGVLLSSSDGQLHYAVDAAAAVQQDQLTSVDLLTTAVNLVSSAQIGKGSVLTNISCTVNRGYFGKWGNFGIVR